MDMYQKRKMRKENKNTNIEDNKNIAKTNINWLTCIYSVHHLNHYKMGIFKN